MSEQPDELTSELRRRAGDLMRGGLTAATQMAMVMASRRAAAHRAAAAESGQQQAAAERRIRAEHAAAQPVMRLAWNDRWWRDAPPDQVSSVWKVTAGWAGNGDPYAAATLDKMRGELQRRHGVQPPATEPQADLSTVLARDDTGRAPAGPGVPAGTRDAAAEVSAIVNAAALLDQYEADWPAEGQQAAPGDLRGADVTRIAGDAGRRDGAADDQETASAPGGSQDPGDVAATAARGFPQSPHARLAARRSGPAPRRPARQRSRAAELGRTR